ncbi:glycerate kinase [Maribellus sp. YY47]|uniref:glycerate kinase n=1 Tax=Maribellus sp. YY47 TaxID=2929486 RepID=UPI00200139B7|nr:glycerate kinase [Maribellus sp. YY47]MCK3685157.1 glycerate kinase [Maribellus sp. YY47]
MKILIAPNSMKGSLNAFDFADVLAKAFQQVSPDFEIHQVPVADGGDFTGEVLARRLNAEEVAVTVTGPLEAPVNAKYAVTGETAIIEMADASGMKLVERSALNPFIASSYGTGELMADAIQKGCKKIYLAIGGSATVDGGVGMLEALGFRFLDESGKQLKACGKILNQIVRVEKPTKQAKVTLKIICDVDNPLLGKSGAAAVFGPQKGATQEMVTALEKGLEKWAGLLEEDSGKSLRNIKGAGAAGGMSVPLIAFYDAEIVPGADFVLDQLGLKEEVQWADIVITGEGKIDGQTLNNKAPYAVAQMARAYGKPVFAIGGKTEPEASGAFDGIYSLVNGAMSLDEAMARASDLLFQFGLEFAKTIRCLSGAGQEK